MPNLQRNLGIALLVASILFIIFISLIKSDIDERDALLCSAVFSNPELDMKECPAHKNNTSWYINGAFVLAFLIMGAAFYFLFAARPHKEIAKELPEPIDVSKLAEDEKKIYDLLHSHEGSMYQSDLIRDTGFSKVYITRVLDKMESKKILERKRRGMTNIVVLK